MTAAVASFVGTRFSWVFAAVRFLVWLAVMIPVALICLVLSVPLVIAFAFTLVLRVIVGFAAGIIYPPLGRVIMPNDDFGDDGWFDRALDVTTAPMDWVDGLLP